jgi:hypothetical protein
MSTQRCFNALISHLGALSIATGTRGFVSSIGGPDIIGGLGLCAIILTVFVFATSSPCSEELVSLHLKLQANKTVKQ